MDPTLSSNKDKEFRFRVTGKFKEVWKDRSSEVVVSGPAGTGKTREILELFHARLFKYPGTRAIMARATRESMTQSCMKEYELDVAKIPRGSKSVEGVYKVANESTYFYPNGSYMVYCGLDDPNKIMSTQFTWGYVNEATDIRIDQWEMLNYRIRYPGPYNQLMGDCNPNSPSHWIKRRSIEQSMTLYETTLKDNPVMYDEELGDYTKLGKDYIKRMGTSTGARKKRLLYGIWCSEEGAVYEAEWKPEIHLIPGYVPPDNWERIWVFDFGYFDPFVWLNVVIDPVTHALIVHQQIYMTKRRVEEHCETIKEVTKGQRRPSFLVCDHDAENRATLEKYLNMVTVPAHKGIRSGINAVKNRLREDWGADHKGRPISGLFVMYDPPVKEVALSSDDIIAGKDEEARVLNKQWGLVEIDKDLLTHYQPVNTQQEFDRYVWKTNPLRNVDEPVDKFNHGMDALQYLVSFVDDVAIDPQNVEEYIVYDNDPDDVGYVISPY